MLGMDSAKGPHQGLASDGPQGHHVDRRIELVSAFRRTSGTFIELRVAIDGNRLDGPNRRNDIIPDIAEGLDHVRPFLGRRNLEGLAAALLPGCRCSKKGPGREDSADLVGNEIIVERLDLACAPRRGEEPRSIAGLILTCGYVRPDGIPGAGLHRLRWRRRCNGGCLGGRIRRDRLSGSCGCNRQEGQGKKLHQGNHTPMLQLEKR